MEKMKSWMMAAILCCGASCFTSCNGNAQADKAAGDTVAAQAAPSVDPVKAAVDKYMVDSIGVYYSQAEVCIPSVTIVAKEQRGTDTVQVWGDFWVFNYNVAGDTLKMASGGDHPGMMSLVKAADGTYRVVSFDRVGDGSEYMPSAKRIFGDKYEAFHSVNSRQRAREEVRARGIADYVKANGLSVKYYQDFGWPAHEIPIK